MTQAKQRSTIVYSFIEDYIEQKGYAPNLREIEAGCDIPLSSVQYHIDQLEGQGCLAREPHLSRSIRLVKSPQPLDDDTQRVYDYLTEQVEQQHTPTQREIADACYLSRWTVRRCLAKLEARGIIRRLEGQRRIALLKAS